MAEILKAQSYTSVMKTSHEDIYTLFIRAKIGLSGLPVLEGNGGSVGAYKIFVSGTQYTLVLEPPSGFRGDTVGDPAKDPHWNWAGAPSIAVDYNGDVTIGNDLVACISIMDFENVSGYKRPYMVFDFVARSEDTRTVKVPAEDTYIGITIPYTLSKNK